MIGALAARAGVLHLDGVDESARELEVVCSADPWQIGGVEPGCARLDPSASYVARELTETIVRRRFALVPDDHLCPAKRFTPGGRP